MNGIIGMSGMRTEGTPPRWLYPFPWQRNRGRVGLSCYCAHLRGITVHYEYIV